MALDPFPLLLELLEDDRAAGMPWTDEDFAQRVGLICRHLPAESWRAALLDLTDAWRSAYERMPTGALQQFGPELLAGESGERAGSLTLG